MPFHPNPPFAFSPVSPASPAQKSLFPRAAVIWRCCWAISAQKGELQVIYSSKIWRQTFWPESRGFLLISQAGGRGKNCSFMQKVPRGGREIHFCLSLLQPGGSCCPGGYVCRAEGRAGWWGLTVVGHVDFLFSLYTQVGRTERKGKFVVCLIIYF